MYRRRRLVAGLALIMVAAVLFMAGMTVAKSVASGEQQPPAPDAGAGAPSGAPAATPASVPTGSADPNHTAAAAPACDPAAIRIEASTDKTSYSSGEQPLLGMKITNTSDIVCTVNAGTSQMDFLVSSDGGRIFSSKDCQVKAEDKLTTLRAGSSETANFPWQLTRSAPGCPTQDAAPGSGRYTFTAKLGADASNKADFELK